MIVHSVQSGGINLYNHPALIFLPEADARLATMQRQCIARTCVYMSCVYTCHVFGRSSSHHHHHHSSSSSSYVYVCIHVMCVYVSCLRAIHDFHHSHRILGKDHWPPDGRKHNCTEVHFRLSPHVTGSQLHPEGHLRKQDTIGTPEDTKD